MPASLKKHDADYVESLIIDDWLLIISYYRASEQSIILRDQLTYANRYLWLFFADDKNAGYGSLSFFIGGFDGFFSIYDHTTAAASIEVERFGATEVF